MRLLFLQQALPSPSKIAQRMGISQLPEEVLLLVLANLHIQDIKSLALTFDKDIATTCLPLLRPLSAKLRNEKAMADRFQRQGLRASEFVAVDFSLRREGLSEPWHRWVDLWDAVEIDQEELPRLSALDIPSGPASELARAWSRPNPLTTHQFQTLAAKAESLDVHVPPSFWKAMSDREMIDQITLAGNSFIQVEEFELLKTTVTAPKIGFMLPFLYEPDRYNCCWYLYLEPGEEHRHCVLSMLDVGQTTDIDMRRCGKYTALISETVT